MSIPTITNVSYSILSILSVKTFLTFQSLIYVFSMFSCNSELNYSSGVIGFIFNEHLLDSCSVTKVRDLLIRKTIYYQDF
jgi:hypothetical protein